MCWRLRCIKSWVRHSPHLEHYGFVAYAGAEFFSLGHTAIWLVAAWLFLTDLLVELVDKEL